MSTKAYLSEPDLVFDLNISMPWGTHVALNFPKTLIVYVLTCITLGLLIPEI